MENSSLSNNNDENNLNELNSFGKFIQHFQNMNLNLIVNWNRERERYLHEDLNKRKIILKEINQIDFKVYIFFK
jgi:hypothetical protein